MFHVPNKCRLNDGSVLSSTAANGNNGFFIVPHFELKDHVFTVMASDGMGWEHASVSVRGKTRQDWEPTRCPTWEEMCHIKSLFWDEDDCVIQYHPAKSEYVNRHQYVLHLWRPTQAVVPIPLKEMVG